MTKRSLGAMSCQLGPLWQRRDEERREDWRREVCFMVAAIVPMRELWHGCENYKEEMSGRHTYELWTARV